MAVAVEGILDEVIVRRLISDRGGLLGPVYGRQGKNYLHQKIGGFNHAAAHTPWFVLVDLDHDHACPAALRSSWLPVPARDMCFRVAVRAVESWLLADRDAIATFLGIALSHVPRDPEAQPDPKRLIVDLARHSRRRDVREGLVPRVGSGRAVGPAYISVMSEFAARRWRPEVAEDHAESLRRCRARLDTFLTDSMSS